MKNIEQVLKRLERKIDLLSNQQKKDRWVKVSVVLKATGWNSKELRKFRENGLIAYRRINGAIEYNFNSIPDQFLISTTSERPTPS